MLEKMPALATGPSQTHEVWVEHPDQVHGHSIAIQQIASLAIRN